MDVTLCSDAFYLKVGRCEYQSSEIFITQPTIELFVYRIVGGLTTRSTCDKCLLQTIFYKA